MRVHLQLHTRDATAPHAITLLVHPAIADAFQQHTRAGRLLGVDVLLTLPDGEL